MSTETVGIDFVGRDGVSGPARNVNAAINGVATQSQKANAMLSAMGNTLGALGSIGTIGAIGGAVVALAKMGAESAQLESRFRALAGGARESEKALLAMSAATEGALTRDGQMVALNSILASGLVDNADKASQLARAAVYLGSASQSAAQRVDTLTAALVSGRDRGLREYGVNMEVLKRRIDELKAANGELSDSQATLNAFMEQAPGLVSKVAAEGGKAATSFEAATVATENLKDAIGGLVNKAAGKFEVAQGINVLAEGINGASDEYYEFMAAAKGASDALAEVEFRQKALNDAIAQNGNVEGAQNVLHHAEANRDLAEALLWAAQAALVGEENISDGERAYIAQSKAAYEAAGGLNAFAAGMPSFTSELDNMTGSLMSNVTWLGEFKAAADRAANMRAPQIANPNLGFDLWMGTTQNTPYGRFDDAPTADEQMDVLGRIEKFQDELNRQTAFDTAKYWKDAAGDVSKAWKDGISDVKGELSRGMSVSKGLSDLTGTGGGGAEDPNGWMRDIRRLQAWVNDGSWGETAAQFGISDKGDAKERIRKFQSGQWDASVTALIDKDKLGAQLKDAGTGQAFVDAFAADVANASGQDPKVVKALLGFQGDKTGTGALDMKPLAAAVSSSFASEINVSSGEFTKAGGAVAGYFGQGFVDTLKASGLLNQAITAIVYSVLPKK